MQCTAASLLAEIGSLLDRANREIQSAETLTELDKTRVRLLGKSGEITRLLKMLGAIPADERPRMGLTLNSMRSQVESKLQERRAVLALAPLQRPSGIDVTLPGRVSLAGHIHPLTSTAEEMKRILRGLGFSYNDYPDIETEYFNFDALNTPAWHPSRDLHDSFYTETGHVLRTHTSAFQVRAMRAHEGPPPIRTMTTGRCYRRDEIDASHFPIFQQLDAIAVGQNITMADLKWTLTALTKGLFGPETVIRFRPSYFPFTTPSAEVDVSCVVCGQRGCQLCSRTGWLEVLGSGMIRPEVLRVGGLDAEKYRGFAFGIGVDRIAMLRYQISDIRLLYANEEAFLRQF